ALAARTYDLAAYLEGAGSLADATNLPGLASEAGPDGDRPVAVHHFCQSATRLNAGDRVDRLLQGCGADTRAVEGGMCCGFGGQTSMLAPEMSQQILRRKLAAAQDTGAPVLVTDNPGCLLHMRGGADA